MSREETDAEVTRRAWMLTIGSAGTLLGVTDLAHAASASAGQLPPGLYAPSGDHLGHALMNAEQFHPIPTGCPTDYVRPRVGPYQPAFFSAHQFQVIRRMTGLLLGEPDAAVSQEVAEWIDLRASAAPSVREAALHLSPMHREVAVAYSGAAPVQELETSDPQKVWREGLDWIAGHAKDFLSLSADQQLQLLDSISDQRKDQDGENAGTRLFKLLKGEVVRGFYTSKVGLKELDFKGNAFYARSPGCKSA